MAFLAMTATAAKKPVELQKNPLLNKAQTFAFPDEHNVHLGAGLNLGTQSLGEATVSNSRAASPGTKVGDTWYDYQHNGTMGRMIGWGKDSVDGFVIHFTFMDLPTEDISTGRGYGYNAYFADKDGVEGTFLGEKHIGDPVDDYGGYVGVDVTWAYQIDTAAVPDDTLSIPNRAVVGGHMNSGALIPYQTQLHYDFGVAWAYFGGFSRVPDSTSGYLPIKADQETIWPKFRYQDVPFNDPVTHCFSQVSNDNAADPQPVYYFRKVGYDQNGAWDYPPYVVDTIFDLSQDVACSRKSGKMALVWTGNLPAPGDCDTCSDNTGNEADFSVQLDNDMYYQISYDYGATFSPRVNLTKNERGVDGYRPYTDASALITEGSNVADDENLHIAWSGRVWPADAGSGGSVGYDCRMFHWGENLGFVDRDGGSDTDPQLHNVIGNIRTAGNLEWDQEQCNGGAWQMNGSKMSISECDGKLYFLWVQFNDVANGLVDDCAARAQGGTGDVVGSANGDLYVAVSNDGGLTWDKARNLTNSYTPGCDSATGTGGRCESDHWPSMARYGTNIVGENMSQAVEVNLPTTFPYSDYWLDVQYVSDPDAGGIVQDEGTWQLADIKWFRMNCVEPEPVALFNPSWREIAFPAWAKHNIQVDTPLTIENSGNTALSFTFALEEDATGAPANWLGIGAGFTGTINIPSGAGNTLTDVVKINNNSVVNDPGTIVYLSGRLIATGNQEDGPDTLPIEFWVADTVIKPEWDTVYAVTGSRADTCTSLAVANNGNMGRQGERNVNLDFYLYGDCDDAEYLSEGDTLPGASYIYLYDGSPVVCWTDATDTVRCNWSIFDDGYLSDNGFFPWAHTEPVDMGDYEMYTGTFVTRDTGMMFVKTWYAPRPATDSCKFLIQALKITSEDGTAHNGLAIGEAIDWDIPADSGSRNRSGFDATRRLIYQQGSEYDDDDAYECMDNSDRYGGSICLDIWENGVLGVEQYGAYTIDNHFQVYPAGGLVPDSMWKYMGNNEGYVLSDSVDSDLHSVMTYRWDYDLGATDELEIYTCVLSSNSGYTDFIATADECHAWYKKHIRKPMAPVLDPIGDQTFNVQTRGSFGVSATDGNLDDLTLTVDDLAQYFTDHGDGTGTFEWDAQVGDVGDYPLRFTVSDGSLEDYEDITLTVAAGCCENRGDVDHLGGSPPIDISDLVYLVDYMFTNGPEPPCMDEGDIDGLGGEPPIDISDLVYLVDYMFTNGPAPPPC
jgi:hypothetical protein